MSEIKVGSIVTVPGWPDYGVVRDQDHRGLWVMSAREGDDDRAWFGESGNRPLSDLTLVLPPLSDGQPAAPVDDAAYQRARRELWSRIAALVFADEYKAEACADHADMMLAEFDARFGRNGGGDE